MPRNEIDALFSVNPRQARFVDEYLVDLNATQAAIRAGYSKKSANQQASDLLALPKIQTLLAERRREMAAEGRLSVAQVLAQLARPNGESRLGQLVEQFGMNQMDLAKIGRMGSQLQP